MGKVTGFLEHARTSGHDRPVDERVRDSREVGRTLPVLEAREQAARCMDCGVPFCHSQVISGHGGCPLGNVIPEFNDRVYRGDFAGAAEVLARTNNFPEVTGRVCPAPCERSCTLEPTGQPVAIEAIERFIADREFELNGAFVPRPPKARSEKRVAVVGSGPAGLACAQQLARAGHHVEVFERSDRLGGLLRYGIPDFKLEKRWLDRRIEQLRAEGVVFHTGVNVGVGRSLASLTETFDAVAIATGASKPRDLAIEGRELDGVHFAMEYLEGQNRVVAGMLENAPIDARGKRVVVLGGGDTGSDCIGTAVRQGASSVTNLELFPAPPTSRDDRTPWPTWPRLLTTSSSHEEAALQAGHDVRRFALETLRFVGRDGRVTSIEVRPVRLEGGRIVPAGELESIQADLVLLAAGFIGVDHSLGLSLDARGNVASDAFATAHAKVFACGDARRGQSLVVWAIREGRDCATAIDARLRG